MIRILHKVTGALLLEVDSPSLAKSDLKEANLREADLRNADLRQASLELADLTGADLSGANLLGADLYNAELRDSDLSGASLDSARLTGAQAQRAQLIGCDLSHATLDNANLTDANLTGANLEDAKLTSPYLAGANFTDARLLTTQFQLCTDLHKVFGLESVQHPGLSSMDQFTARRSLPYLPDSFLAGVGYGHEIGQLRRLYGPVRYHTCFLSHAQTDLEFAGKLRDDLIKNHVVCWHFKHDLRGGKPWRAQISTAIRKHAKLVLVCSKESVLRPNVVSEIVDAIERERETGDKKLFPIRLDDFILSKEMLAIADEKMEAGDWREDWVRYIRAFHIPDFREWRNDDRYAVELGNLLRDLQSLSP